MQILAYDEADEAAVVALWRYGRAMMAEVESLLLACGCPKLNLQVRASNVEVLAFYRHLGYVQDEAVSLGKRLIVDAPAGDGS